MMVACSVCVCVCVKRSLVRVVICVCCCFTLQVFVFCEQKEREREEEEAMGWDGKTELSVHFSLAGRPNSRYSVVCVLSFVPFFFSTIKTLFARFEKNREKDVCHPRTRRPGSVYSDR